MSNEVQQECPTQAAVHQPQRASSLSWKIARDNATSQSSSSNKKVGRVHWKDEDYVDSSDSDDDNDDEQPISGCRWESFSSPSCCSSGQNSGDSEWDKKWSPEGTSTSLVVVSPPLMTRRDLKTPSRQKDFLLPCPRRRISMDRDELGDLLVFCTVQDLE